MSDHDTTDTIIEAVREWQAAQDACDIALDKNEFASASASGEALVATALKLRALRLPPKGEGR